MELLDRIEKAIETEQKFRSTATILIQGGEFTKRKHQEELAELFNEANMLAEDMGLGEDGKSDPENRDSMLISNTEAEIDQMEKDCCKMFAFFAQIGMKRSDYYQ
tara:strand:- start:462 stop:776 length:315 start_codon:yes stop_codon:yes gene_type:complete